MNDIMVSVRRKVGRTFATGVGAKFRLICVQIILDGPSRWLVAQKSPLREFQM